jgi:hypothetical protein
MRLCYVALFVRCLTVSLASAPTSQRTHTIAYARCSIVSLASARASHRSWKLRYYGNRGVAPRTRILQQQLCKSKTISLSSRPADIDIVYEILEEAAGYGPVILQQQVRIC